MRATRRTRLYPRADNETDTPTVGVRATLVTSAQVPEAVVYAVARAVLGGLDHLRESAPAFGALRQDELLDGLTAPMHPGAQRAFTDAGLQIPEQLR